MDRRTFLTASTSAGVLGVAGCVGSFDDDSGARIEELESQLEAKNQTIDALEADADAYELRLAEKNDEINRLEGDLAEKRDDLTALESDLDEKRAKLADKRDELDRLETDLDAAETEVATLEAEVAQLESTVSTLERDIDDYRIEIAELEARIETLEPDHDFSDAEVEAAVDIAHDVRSSVVEVWSTSTSRATGYQIEPGVFATVDHAFDGTVQSGYPRVWTFSGDDFGVRSEAFERDIDLRVLEGETSVSGTIDVHAGGSLSSGDPVVCVGHPMNVGNWVIAVGRFDTTQRPGSGIDERLRFDMPVRAGNSGSPIVTLDGEFVGMTIQATEDRDTYDRPDEPFFSYGPYEPIAVGVPDGLIADQLSAWGY